MQYIVNANGKVLSEENEVYVIDASSKKEAEQKAITVFRNKYKAQCDLTIEERKNERFPIIIFGITFIIILIFSQKGWLVGTDKMVNIGPTFPTGILAVLLGGSLIYNFNIIRYDTNNGKRFIINLLLFAVFIYIVACFLRIAVFTKTINLFMFSIDVDSVAVISIALIASFAGLKIISALGYILVVVLCIGNINVLDAALGKLSIIYLIALVLSIFSYLYITCATYQVLHFVQQKLHHSKNYIVQDISTAGEQGKQLYNSMNKKEIEDSTNNRRDEK